jgi:DNA-binding SARP family transcriptional activator/tetratricopeptide (TPR) repeat protein
MAGERSASLPDLKLHLLGPPSVAVEGEPIQVDTRKAIALLAYLALEGGVHQRDGLAALLWPESDQPHARGALRRTLFALREGVGREWISADRESMRLKQSPGLWIDALEFERLLDRAEAHAHGGDRLCAECERRYRAAVDLYRDDFMAGFSLRDSPEFDDWQFFKAQALRKRFGDALRRLVRSGAAAGSFSQSIEDARRWLATDEFNEAAHQQLMRLYAWSGHRNAALRQYRECVRVLQEELGVAPLQETTELNERIRAGELPEPPGVADLAGATKDDDSHHAPAERPGGIGVRDLPFVGRSAELASLVEAYRSIAEAGIVVAVEGEAGVGKSRLAREFVREVLDTGAQVIQVQAYEGETDLAYGPLAEVSRKLIAAMTGEGSEQPIPEEWLSEVSRLLPSVAQLSTHVPEPPPMDSPGSRIRFYEALYRLTLRLNQAGATGVLVLDDLHWADEASLRWLRFLCRRLKDDPLYVLLLYRRAEARGQPAIQKLIAESRRSATLKRIRLERLKAEEVKRLITLITGDAAPDSTERGERLFHETEGLPLYLQEYLAALERGDLDWEVDDWTLPGGIQDLLRARLQSMSEMASQLLTTAAVIGRAFGYELLSRASGRGDEETIQGLEELTALGFLRPVAGEFRAAAYDFSHSKVREFVRAETSPPRVRLLHQRIAKAISQRGPRRRVGSDAALIAHHYESAGREDLAAQYYASAGEYAADLFANDEALEHYERALALGHPETGDLHVRIGDLHKLTGSYRSAIDAYEAAATYHAGERLAPIEQRLGQIYHLLGEWEVADGHYGTVEALVDENDLATRAKLYVDWSLTQLQKGEMERALDLAQAGEDLAERAGDSTALAMCRNLLGLLQRKSGDLGVARSLLEESRDISEKMDDPGLGMAALNNLALVLRDEGDQPGAIEMLNQALEAAVARGDRHHEAALRSNLADALYDAGREAESMQQLKQAAVIFADVGEEMGDRQPEIWKLTEW